MEAIQEDGELESNQDGESNHDDESNHDHESTGSHEESDSEENSVSGGSSSEEEGESNDSESDDERKQEVTTVPSAPMVSVRIRPRLDEELSAKQHKCTNVENTLLGGRVNISPDPDFPGENTKFFSLNGIAFSETATQSEVYEETVFPLVEAAFKG